MKHIYHYLPLSDEVRARSLFVLAGGSASVPAGMPYPPPAHPHHHQFDWKRGRVLHEYQMIYIARGGGVLETRTAGPQRVQTGDLFVLFPDEWHRYSPDPETGWDEHWVAYQGKRAAEVMAERGVSPLAPLFHTEATDLLQREFVRIEEEVAEEKIDYQSVVVARTQLILALAMAAHRRQSVCTPDVSQTIQRAKLLLREQMDQPGDLQTLAAELQVGYPWLRKMFRQYTGLPLAQYQMHLRVKQACELLRTTRLPIAAIGVRCGFESSYYFARVFRGKMGCTPSSYRLQSQGQVTQKARADF